MLWATFLSQNVYVYIQPLLRNAPRAITPFKVIRSQRFWYQSIRARNLPQPAPDNVLAMLQILSKSIRFREHHQNAP